MRSRQSDKCLVAKIELDDNTYYVSSRAVITLDSIVYVNSVLSWGDIPYKAGQLANPEKKGGGFDIGSLAITMVHGEKVADIGYEYDITDVWNNYTCTVKQWSTGVTTFAGCADYAKGLIKDFKSGNGQISFTVEARDGRDDALLPSIIIEDQSAIAGAQAQSPATVGTAGTSTVTVLAPDNFGIGELVRLSNQSGAVEYHQIISKAGNVLTLNDPLVATFDVTTSGLCEKAFRHAPEVSIGKTIPIQIGDLGNGTGGVFGKACLVNNLIGQQAIVTDSIGQNDTTTLGIWDDSLSRYYAALRTGEFRFNGSKSVILFSVDTTATLAAAITDIAGDISSIAVDDYTKLAWVDETTAGTPAAISANVLAIDRELVLLLQKPVSNTIWVERGFASTQVTTHALGAAVYQSAKYSSKNLISFDETFYPYAFANHYMYLNPPQFPNNCFTGSWADVLEADLTNYLQLWYDSDYYASTPRRILKVNFDAQFAHTTISATATKAYVGCKFRWNTNGTALSTNYVILGLLAPDTTFGVAGSSIATSDSSTQYANFTWIFHTALASESDGDFDGITTEYETTQSIDGGKAYYKPDISVADYAGAEVNYYTGSYQIQSLSDLNKRWKFQLRNQCLGGYSIVGLYALNLRILFYLPMTEYPLLGERKGRNITTDVATITGATAATLCENPADVLALLLTQSLGYSTSDFTTAWSDARTYMSSVVNYPEVSVPIVATSYGYDDEQKRGWDLCEWMASHFNMLLTKTTSGKIDTVNLHEIYNATPAGTEIHIDDIAFLDDSGSRRFSIMQTGTDLIYNDFIIRWKRNNSTDKYQEVYRLPDTYALTISGTSLQGAREQFYNGDKRTLEMESPFIYSEDDAARKAKWEADDKAEVHFFVDFVLDSAHWTEVAGKSAQYKIGDIVYFRGKADGIDFTATQTTAGKGRFYIQEITLGDSGREILISAKSIQNVKEFVTTAVQPALTVWDDTGGTAITGNAIKDDTAGTGVTGNDIKDDTGG